MGRCDAYLAQHKFEPALADLERAQSATPGLQVQPHIADAYCARAQQRAAKGKPDLALKDLSRALKINAKHADSYAARAAIHRERMDYADALADFRRALQADPGRKAQLAPEIQKLESMLK